MVAIVVILLTVNEGELSLTELSSQISDPINSLIEVYGEDFEDQRYIPLDLLEGVLMQGRDAPEDSLVLLVGSWQLTFCLIDSF